MAAVETGEVLRKDSVHEWINQISTEQEGPTANNGIDPEVITEESGGASGLVSMETCQNEAGAGTDELLLGAEAKLLPRSKEETSSLGAGSDSRREDDVISLVTKRRQVTWRERFATNFHVDSFNSEGSHMSYSSLDQILQDRERDPEDVLASLGFGSSDSDPGFSCPVPDRFLTSQSSAAGITTDTFAAHNPEYRDYVMLTRTMSQEAAAAAALAQCQGHGEDGAINGGSSSVSFSEMAWQMVLARRFMGCASLPDLHKALAGISQKDSIDESLYDTVHCGSTGEGAEYVSVLHPDNSLHLSKFGHYDEEARLLEEEELELQEAERQARVQERVQAGLELEMQAGVQKDKRNQSSSHNQAGVNLEESPEQGNNQLLVAADELRRKRSTLTNKWGHVSRDDSKTSATTQMKVDNPSKKGQLDPSPIRSTPERRSPSFDAKKPPFYERLTMRVSSVDPPSMSNGLTHDTNGNLLSPPDNDPAQRRRRTTLHNLHSYQSDGATNDLLSKLPARFLCSKSSVDIRSPLNSGPDAPSCEPEPEKNNPETLPKDNGILESNSKDNELPRSRSPIFNPEEIKRSIYEKAFCKQESYGVEFRKEPETPDVDLTETDEAPGNKRKRSDEHPREVHPPEKGDGFDPERVRGWTRLQPGVSEMSELSPLSPAWYPSPGETPGPLRERGVPHLPSRFLKAMKTLEQPEIMEPASVDLNAKHSEIENAFKVRNVDTEDVDLPPSSHCENSQGRKQTWEKRETKTENAVNNNNEPRGQIDSSSDQCLDLKQSFITNHDIPHQTHRSGFNVNLSIEHPDLHTEDHDVLSTDQNCNTNQAVKDAHTRNTTKHVSSSCPNPPIKKSVTFALGVHDVTKSETISDVETPRSFLDDDSITFYDVFVSSYDQSEPFLEPPDVVVPEEAVEQSKPLLESGTNLENESKSDAGGVSQSQSPKWPRNYSRAITEALSRDLRDSEIKRRKNSEDRNEIYYLKEGAVLKTKISNEAIDPHPNDNLDIVADDSRELLELEKEMVELEKEPGYERTGSQEVDAYKNEDLGKNRERTGSLVTQTFSVLLGQSLNRSRVEERDIRRNHEMFKQKQETEQARRNLDEKEVMEDNSTQAVHNSDQEEPEPEVTLTHSSEDTVIGPLKDHVLRMHSDGEREDRRSVCVSRNQNKGNIIDKEEPTEEQPLCEEPEEEIVEPTLLELSNVSSQSQIEQQQPPTENGQSASLNVLSVKPKRKKSESVLKLPGFNKRRKSDTSQSDLDLLVPPDQSKRRNSDVGRSTFYLQPLEQSELSKSDQSLNVKSDQSRRRNSDSVSYAGKRRKSSSPLDVLVALGRKITGSESDEKQRKSSVSQSKSFFWSRGQPPIERKPEDPDIIRIDAEAFRKPSVSIEPPEVNSDCFADQPEQETTRSDVIEDPKASKNNNVTVQQRHWHQPVVIRTGHKKKYPAPPPPSRTRQESPPKYKPKRPPPPKFPVREEQIVASSVTLRDSTTSDVTFDVDDAVVYANPEDISRVPSSHKQSRAPLLKDIEFTATNSDIPTRPAPPKRPPSSPKPQRPPPPTREADRPLKPPRLFLTIDLADSESEDPLYEQLEVFAADLEQESSQPIETAVADQSECPELPLAEKMKSLSNEDPHHPHCDWEEASERVFVEDQAKVEVSEEKEYLSVIESETSSIIDESIDSSESSFELPRPPVSELSVCDPISPLYGKTDLEYKFEQPENSEPEPEKWVTKLKIEPPAQGQSLTLTNVSAVTLTIDEGQVTTIKDGFPDAEGHMERHVTEPEFKHTSHTSVVSSNRKPSYLELSNQRDYSRTGNNGNGHSNGLVDNRIRDLSGTDKKRPKFNLKIRNGEVSKDEIACLHLSVTKSAEGVQFSAVDGAEVVKRRACREGSCRADVNTMAPEEWAKHQVLCSMVKSDQWSPGLDSLVFQYPQSVVDTSPKMASQVQVDEVKLVQHAVNKYKLETRNLELRASDTYRRQSALTNQQIDEIDMLVGLRQQISQELKETEHLLAARLDSFINTNNNNSDNTDLSSNGVINNMIDLLKEQVYHGNMLDTIATDDLDESDGWDRSLESSSVSIATNVNSQDSIITQLSLLQQQLSSQQQRQSQQLKYTMNEFRSTLLTEIRQSIFSETQLLRQQVQATEDEISRLQRRVSAPTASETRRSSRASNEAAISQQERPAMEGANGVTAQGGARRGRNPLMREDSGVETAEPSLEHVTEESRSTQEQTRSRSSSPEEDSAVVQEEDITASRMLRSRSPEVLEKLNSLEHAPYEPEIQPETRPRSLKGHTKSLGYSVDKLDLNEDSLADELKDMNCEKRTVPVDMSFSVEELVETNGEIENGYKNDINDDIGEV